MTPAETLLAEIKIKIQSRFDLDDEAFEDVFDKASFVKIMPEQVLFQEGRHNNFVYIVAKGVADVFKKKVHISSVGAGDVLGEMSLIGVDKSSATVIAKTEMMLFRFKKDWFDILLNRYPQMNTVIVAEAIKRKIEQSETPA